LSIPRWHEIAGFEPVKSKSLQGNEEK